MALVPTPNQFQRLSRDPLDNTNAFATYAALTAYAISPTAYRGQICSVSATNLAYIINNDFTVQPIALTENITTLINSTSSVLLPTSVYQSTSGTFATNTALNAASSVLLPTSIYQNASGNWTGGFKILADNEYNLDCSSYELFYKAVTSINIFTYSNFNPGQSITIYLSAVHPLSVRHYFPTGTYLQKAGEANYAYTYTDRVTKITIHNLGNSYLGVANTIATNVPQYIIYDVYSIDSLNAFTTILGDPIVTI